MPHVVLVGHAGIVGAARYAPTLIRHQDSLLQLIVLGCDVSMKMIDNP